MASSGMTTVKVFFVLFNLAFMVSSNEFEDDFLKD